MLRMFLLQSCFNLSNEAVEDSIYDSYAMRMFMKLDFMSEQAPDATTLCKFRKLLVDNDIAKTLFDAIANMLTERGHMLKGGSVVDATIIEAPTSTKNSSGKRDPEMHQAKKGNQWHFEMKTHVGADAGMSYIHSVTATAANAHDITEAHKLIREDDEVVYGDAGYLGVDNRDEIVSDAHKSKVEYCVNRRPGAIRKIPAGIARDFEKYLERHKSSVRARVEYAFLVNTD